MISAYSLDPAVVENVPAFAFLVGQLGVENGRVIHEDFPKDWFEQAGTILREVPSEAQRTVLTELLKRLRLSPSIRVRSDFPFDRTTSWVGNALAAPERFDGIIVGDGYQDQALPDNASRVGEVVTGKSQIWEVKRSSTFPATIDDTVSVLQPLLNMSDEVVVMDPYFTPRSKKLRLAKGIIDAMARDKTIEFHAKAEREGHKDYMPPDLWKRLCRTNLAPLVQSRGISGRIVRWLATGSRSKVHERWVVTEHGGVLLDRGLHLKEGDENVCHLMSHARSRDLYQQYRQGEGRTGQPPDYELVDSLFF